MTGTTKATKAGDCRKCGKAWAVGDEIEFVNGTRKDGSTFNMPQHAKCPEVAPSTAPNPPPSPAMVKREPTAWLHVEVSDMGGEKPVIRVEYVQEDKGQSPSSLIEAAIKGIRAGRAKVE